MIKQFLDKVEDVALRAMFRYIDSNLDSHDHRLKEQKKDINQLKEDYRKIESVEKDVNKIVESGAETRKLIKKASITALVGGIVTYILAQLGFL